MFAVTLCLFGLCHGMTLLNGPTFDQLAEQEKEMDAKMKRDIAALNPETPDLTSPPIEAGPSSLLQTDGDDDDELEAPAAQSKKKTHESLSTIRGRIADTRTRTEQDVNDIKHQETFKDKLADEEVQLNALVNAPNR